MRLAGHVVRVEDRSGAYRVLVERERQTDLSEKDHLEDQNVDGRIILQWIVKTWNGEA